MKKHDIVEGVIDTYEFPNKGSFHMDDRKVTVKGAIKGQKVSCRITKLKKGKADGRLLEVLEKSELEDASPVCSHFGMCGGCSYQTLSYENQLKVKEELVKGLLDGVIDSEVHPYEWQGILASPVTKDTGTRWSSHLAMSIRMVRWHWDFTRRTARTTSYRWMTAI